MKKLIASRLWQQKWSINASSYTIEKCLVKWVTGDFDCMFLCSMEAFFKLNWIYCLFKIISTNLFYSTYVYHIPITVDIWAGLLLLALILLFRTSLFFICSQIFVLSHPGIHSDCLIVIVIWERCEYFEEEWHVVSLTILHFSFLFILFF